MATYYIATTGNDTTGSGSSGNPWATISKAHTSASGGDTIICKNGTYTWSNQTFSKALTVQAETNGSVIFDAAATAPQWVFATGCSGLNFTGIKFTGLTASGSHIAFYFSANVTVTMLSCLITACTWNAGGKLVGSSGSGVIVLSTCLIYALNGNSSSTYLIAEYVDATFTGCSVYFSNASAKFQAVFSNNGVNTNTLIVKNTIMASSYSMAYRSATGVATWTTTYTDLYNLTSTPSGTGVITSDPLFVDAAAGNFRLRPTSPCLNTGVAV